MRDGTEPTEDMRRDIFWRSFSDEARHWVDQVNLGGQNDYANMTRSEIAKRMRAFAQNGTQEVISIRRKNDVTSITMSL